VRGESVPHAMRSRSRGANVGAAVRTPLAATLERADPVAVAPERADPVAVAPERTDPVAVAPELADPSRSRPSGAPSRVR